MWIDYADGGSDGEGPGTGCEEMEAHREDAPSTAELLSYIDGEAAYAGR